MKKILLIVMVILTKTIIVQAQTSFMIEQQNYYSKSAKVDPMAYIWASHQFNKEKPFGIFTFGLVNPTWGEILIGPNLIFPYEKGIIEFGAGPGFETNKRFFRGLAYAYHEHKISSKIKMKSLYYAEYGGSGYWYLWYTQFHTPKGFLFGAQAQAFNGVWGPRIGYAKGKFFIYASSGYSIELKEFGVISGIRGVF